ncbi:hypothetical protein DFS34DRAFT_94873 [Phlyctochytrium arcticum]|nr:hypothetical protein DFS34DRAFT_94873 [Phlyctochytrium arcticum]
MSFRAAAGPRLASPRTGSAFSPFSPSATSCRAFPSPPSSLHASARPTTTPISPNLGGASFSSTAGAVPSGNGAQGSAVGGGTGAGVGVLVVSLGLQVGINKWMLMLNDFLYSRSQHGHLQEYPSGPPKHEYILQSILMTSNIDYDKRMRSPYSSCLNECIGLFLTITPLPYSPASYQNLHTSSLPIVCMLPE